MTSIVRAQAAYDAFAWSNWARLSNGQRAGLASSYDRAGFNQDYSHYESPSGLLIDAVPATVRTIAGPGVIHRFWMPHQTADRAFLVRMFFDDEPTPRIDTTSNVLLGGSYGYFTAPLVNTCAGGQVCYDPIPFAESVRIETFNQPLPPNGDFSFNFHYYQYSYSTWPAGTPISTYTGALSPAGQAARDSVVDLFTSAGAHPGGDSPGAVTVISAAHSLAPGGTSVLLDQDGPGLVRRITLAMPSASDADLDAMRLRVTYDCEPAAAIDVPVSQFFGAGHNRAAYRSLPMGTDSADGFYSYWPMPFRGRILIQLQNTSSAPVPIGGAKVEYESMPFADDLGYLRASVLTDLRAPGQVYHPILSVAGPGHYVGNLLYVHQNSYEFGMLEGDEVITVDGTDVMNGTGLEDAYNGGYYYNWVGVEGGEPEGPMPQSATRPLSGILYVHREPGVAMARADQYRWYIADRVPFEQSIEVKIENQYAIDGAEWTSVAFWYQEKARPGDLDGDGDVDSDDRVLFVEALLQGDGAVTAADLNCDGQANGGDIAAFVMAMLE